MTMIGQLMELGMTENESKVYEALIYLGNCKAGEIIKKTKLHRNIVYDNLEKMIAKGLVSYVLVGKTKHFEVGSTQDLKDWLELQKSDLLKKERILHEIIPSIEQKKKYSEIKHEATIFKGNKGLINVLDLITETKGELIVFGTGWGLKESTGSYNDLWYVKLRKNKVKIRILLPLSRKGKYPAPLKVKYLDEEHTIPSTIAVLEDKVINILWGENPTAVMIFGEGIAKSYKNYFEILWRIAKIK